MQSFRGNNLSRSSSPWLDWNEQGTEMFFKLFEIVPEADKCRCLLFLCHIEKGLYPTKSSIMGVVTAVRK